MPSVERKILDRMLDETEWREKLTDDQVEAFESMRERASRASVFVLTEKQSKWVLGVAARIGLIGAEPSENLFSALTPERQAEQRARAAKIRLPWEKP